MTDNGFKELKDVETVQDLTFQRSGATNIHNWASVLTSLVEAQERLKAANVHQYDSNKLALQIL